MSGAMACPNGCGPLELYVIETGPYLGCSSCLYASHLHGEGSLPPKLEDDLDAEDIL